MKIERKIHRVFIRRHKDDPEMIELYTKKHPAKTIVWTVAHCDMLSEMRGNISPGDLENHEYEIVICAPGGRKIS